MRILRICPLMISLSIFMPSMISCKGSVDSSHLQNASNEAPDIDIHREKSVESYEIDSLTKNIRNEQSLILPEGFKLFDKITGDLNGDGLDDYVLITKGTKKGNIVVNRFDEKVDRNRRGIIVYLTDNDNTFLATQNLNCFSSENEDGGVYFPPELTIEIQNGKLYVHYDHGRYGSWKYTFRYQNADFELIGYDSRSMYGPILNQEISINFLTKKKLTRENINQNTEDAGDEIFEENWTDVPIKKLYKLSEIEDFDLFVVI